MSGYAEMVRDQQQADFIGEWTSPDEATVRECPHDFRDQYRFILAHKRAAEAELKKVKGVLAGLAEILK